MGSYRNSEERRYRFPATSPKAKAAGAMLARRFFETARGSLHEVETQILIATHLQYITESEGHEIGNQAAEVGRVLNGLIHSFEPARP